MIGEKVVHRHFGVGTVKQVDYTDGSITIAFEAIRPVLSFAYPNAFSEYLTAADADSQADILQEIAKKDA
jgi:transcription elongation factor GreA-like protein